MVYNIFGLGMAPVITCNKSKTRHVFTCLWFNISKKLSMTIPGLHSKGFFTYYKIYKIDGLRVIKYGGKKAWHISTTNFIIGISATKDHLYHYLFIIQEKTSIYNKAKSHPDLCKFIWVTDNNATLRPEKMLLSVPEHYTVRPWCKSKCTKQCNCKNNDVDCTEFCTFGWVIDAAINARTLYPQMWVQIKMHQTIQL